MCMCASASFCIPYINYLCFQSKYTYTYCLCVRVSTRVSTTIFQYCLLLPLMLPFINQRTKLLHATFLLLFACNGLASFMMFCCFSFVLLLHLLNATHTMTAMYLFIVWIAHLNLLIYLVGVVAHTKWMLPEYNTQNKQNKTNEKTNRKQNRKLNR